MYNFTEIEKKWQNYWKEKVLKKEKQESYIY